MTKRILQLVLVAGSLALVSCSSEPSDLRPEKKVSLDIVPPGTRKTNNLDNASDNSQHDQKKDVMLNHDEHDNKMGNTEKNVDPSNKSSNADSVENHE